MQIIVVSTIAAAVAQLSFTLAFNISSQTIGAGAANLDATFFAQIHHLLSRARLGPASRKLESLNISVSAVHSTQQWGEYSKVAPSFGPDLIVINLSSNDREGELGPGVLKFLDYNEKHAIGTVLLQEANAEGAVSAGLLSKHTVLKILGEAHHVPVWNLHGYLSSDEIRDSGFLWWDSVHLTNWGHQQVARWLAPQLRGEIGRSRGRSGPPTVK